MLNQNQYVILSLELHMFFGRIMKEHAIFLEAGFTPANQNYAKRADHFKKVFETILHNAVLLGNGIVTPESASSGEFVTDFTLGCEQKTQKMTGIMIEHEITRLESNLYGIKNPIISQQLLERVKQLNMLALPQINSIIQFKNKILDEVLSCRMFTVNYPLLLEHIMREANLYKNQLTALESGRNPESIIKNTELFWDQIMMEHALFIRGLLDPSENKLIDTANDFADDYKKLIDQTSTANQMTIDTITDATLRETMNYRDLKTAGTKGIASCQIRSIIPPLLADHVLREANHYIRLLEQFN